MKRSAYLTTELLLAVILICSPTDLLGCGALRNRIRQGQLPIVEVGQPTWRTLAGYPNQYGTNDDRGWFARFGNPTGLAVGVSNDLFVADTGNYTIRRVDWNGNVSTVAGVPGVNGYRNGPAHQALFEAPMALAVDADGDIYVADGNTIRLVNTSGVVSTFVTNANYFSALAWSPDGNLYAADNGNLVIWRITHAAQATVFAGLIGVGGWQDGSGTNALFWGPTGITCDTSGTLYVADSGGVRRISPSGSVTTLAGQPGFSGWNDDQGTNALFNSTISVAVDADSNCFVADSGNNCIRKVTPSGQVSTIAGAPGNSGHVDGTFFLALFANPQAIAVANAKLVVVDANDQTVRVGDIEPEPGLEILRQPQNAVLTNGGAATLEISAQSLSSLEYQWFMGGDPTFDSDVFIDGATGTSLVISNSNFSSGAFWRAAVRDELGYELSSPAWIYEFQQPSPPERPLGPWSEVTSIGAPTVSVAAYGAGQFVAFGTTYGWPVALNSSDGTVWRKQQSFPPGLINPQNPYPLPVFDVTFGNGLFVAVSTSGSVLKSSDGLNWSTKPISPKISPALQSVTWADGIFVAVSSDANGSLWYSADGDFWYCAGFELECYFNKVIADDGKFLALGNTILVSLNGADWLPAELPNSVLEAYGKFDSAAYGNGIFVATKQPVRNWTSCGAPGVLISTNVLEWLDASPTNGTSLAGVCFGNGLFAAIDRYTSMPCFSNDGINWTGPVSISDAVAYLQTITFAGGVFLAFGTDNAGNAVVLSSRDTQTWSLSTSTGTIPDSLTTMLVTPDGYVGLCDGSPVTSTLGTDWTIQPGGPFQSLSAGRGKLVAVGSGSVGLVGLSTNGSNWTMESLSGLSTRAGVTSWGLSAVVYGTGGFVAGGSCQYALAGSAATNFSQFVVSNDGVNWVYSDLDRKLGNSITGLGYGSGTYVAVAFNQSIPSLPASSLLLHSTNGTNWATPYWYTGMSVLSPVIFTHGKFFVVGGDNSGGMMLSSADGATWRRIALPFGVSDWAYGNGLFAAIDTAGYLETSPDAVTWTKSSTSFAVNGRVYAGQGVFLVYGSDEFGNPGLFESQPLEQLLSPAILADGTFQCTVNGARHINYDLQASDDLLGWQVIGSVSNAAATHTFFDLAVQPRANRFYRVQVKQ